MLEADILRNALIPAVPVPFDAQGEIDAPAQERYARWMAKQPVEGVAVWRIRAEVCVSMSPSEPWCWVAGGSV